MLENLLGLTADDLTLVNMAVRAVVVYISALLMVRIGEKRFLGKSTAFDVILGIIFGSVVSRAITGSSEFFSTLGAGLVLVLLHWLFATLAFHFDWFGTWVKGNSHILVKHGNIQWDAMRKSHISEKDLLSALRSNMDSAVLGEIKEARLERSGDITFLKAAPKPKVVEIRVEAGVQVVRVELD